MTPVGVYGAGARIARGAVFGCPPSAAVRSVVGDVSTWVHVLCHSAAFHLRFVGLDLNFDAISKKNNCAEFKF